MHDIKIRAGLVGVLFLESGLQTELLALSGRLDVILLAYVTAKQAAVPLHYPTRPENVAPRYYSSKKVGRIT